MTGAAQDPTADVEDFSLLRSLSDLPRPGTSSTRGLVQYAANDTTLSDVGVTGGATAGPRGRRSTQSKSSDEELADFRNFLSDTDREGPPRKDVYPDSTKHPTVGIGHKVVPGDHLKLGDEVGPDQIDAFFRVDGGDALAAARSQMAEAGIKDESFLLALAAVNFQLGSSWKNSPGGFVKSWANIIRGDYQKAADEISQSKWAAQSPKRMRQFQDALRSLPPKK